jgi:hypothetical protein
MGFSLKKNARAHLYIFISVRAGGFLGSAFHAAAVNQNDCYSSELADVSAVESI